MFRFSFGPSCGSGEEGRGCGRERKKCMHFLVMFVTLKNSKESSQSFAIMAKVCRSQTSFSLPLGFAAHSRGERVCLIKPCLAPQDRITPLHRSAMNGHAKVVEQLLVAGAVKDAKTEVKWAGDEECI